MQTPRLEALEVRRLFVNGTDGDDLIQILAVDENDPLTYQAIVNGVTVEQRTLPEHSWIPVNGLGGNDEITIDLLLNIRTSIRGGEGDDTIVGGGGKDIILGLEGNDLLFGRHAGDDLVGGAGSDTLRGGNGSDRMVGDGEILFLDHTTATGDDFLFGEDGGDLLYSSGADTLNGGAHSDTLVGGAYAFGGDDDDTIRVGFSEPADGPPLNNTLDGGNGIDVLEVTNSGSTAISVTLDGVANDGHPGNMTNVLPTFESFTSRNLPPGSVIDFSQVPAGMTVRFDGDQTTVKPSSSWLTFIGSAFGDRFDMASPSVRFNVQGRGGDDTITGGVGNDKLFGGAGNDKLAGSWGEDMILGEDGNDSIDGGEDRDRITGGVGNDVIHGDVLGMTANWGSDTIEGNAGHDFIMGGGHNDVILGQGGRDTIIGGGSDDRMYGGPGVDKILGGPGTDSAEQSDQDLFESVEIFL